jgi:hypothetical protein
VAFDSDINQRHLKACAKVIKMFFKVFIYKFIQYNIEQGLTVLVESRTMTILESRRGSVSRPDFFISDSGQHQGHLP